MSASSPLVIDGTTVSEADFVALHYRLWRRQRRTRINDGLLALGRLLLGISVGLDGYQNGHVTDFWPAGFLGLAVAYALARGPLVRRQLRQLYARNPALPGQRRLSADGAARLP